MQEEESINTNYIVTYENVYKQKDYTKYLIALFLIFFLIYILIIIKKYK
jgi:hypothetical protein